jgi:hypothetical protein
VQILGHALWVLSEQVEPEDAGGMAGTLELMREERREEMECIDHLLALPNLEGLSELAGLLAGLPGDCDDFYLVARNWLERHPADWERLAAAVPAL